MNHLYMTIQYLLLTTHHNIYNSIKMRRKKTFIAPLKFKQSKDRVRCLSFECLAWVMFRLICII